MKVVFIILVLVVRVKVYVDVILFINFFFDFLLLVTTSLVLKRRVSIKRIALGSLVGSATIVVLFIPLSSLELFLLKVVLSLVIIFVTFGYGDFKYFVNNLVYFYLISIVLGGFVYYLNVSFSYKNVGIVFYHKGVSINYVIVLFLSIVVSYFYYKEMKYVRLVNSLYYKVDIYVNYKIVSLLGYLDTGNTLVDPYSKRVVIITNSKKFIKACEGCLPYYIPYQSVNDFGLLEVYKVSRVYIEGVGNKSNIVVGVVKDKLKSGKVEVLLNNLLMEG